MAIIDIKNNVRLHYYYTYNTYTCINSYRYVNIHNNIEKIAISIDFI